MAALRKEKNTLRGLGGYYRQPHLVSRQVLAHSCLGAILRSESRSAVTSGLGVVEEMIGEKKNHMIR